MGKGTRRQPRTARWQKATALLPLVLLSGALSANATTTGERERIAEAAASGEPGSPVVPSTAFDQPASVALPNGVTGPGATAALAPASDFDITVGNASISSGSMSVNGIPASALSAYQRAAQILDQADPGCNLDWSLVAGVGRVESDHGRYGGNALDGQGKAQPGIYGIPLDGSNGTARILDTDGGALDDDAVFDRAVGPMQFIPGTWSAAGVDADQDGEKDPQDIDDAATASAVYLCAGGDDLSTDSGRRAAVYRYNQSNDYVDLVLSIAASYSGGEYTAVPNGTPSSTTLVPRDFAATPDGKPPRGTRDTPRAGTVSGDTRGGTASSGGASVSDGDGGTDEGSGSVSGGGGNTGRDPGDGGKPDNGNDGGQPDDGDGGGRPDNGRDDPGGDPVRDTVRDTVKKAKEPVEKATEPAEPVVDTLGRGAARSLCESRLTSALAEPLVGTCTSRVTGKTEEQAQGIIDSLLAGL